MYKKMIKKNNHVWRLLCTISYGKLSFNAQIETRTVILWLFFVFFYQEKGELSIKNQEKTNNRHIYKQSMLCVSKKLDYQFDFFS